MFALFFAAAKFVLSAKFIAGFVSGAAAGWGVVRAVAAFIEAQAKQIVK